MKTRAALLLVLSALLPCALAAENAPSPSSAIVPASSAIVSVPNVDRADFLASLSASPSAAPSDLAPVPAFMTGCSSNAQCPPGQICCLACGYAGCENRACFATTVCPHFP